MGKDAKNEMACLAIEERIFDGEEQAAVNARELWKALGSKQEFANWIKDRIADFKEGQDFTVDKFINGRNERGRFASKEYYITLDVAKHLAMLERNDAGRKIRQYFIAVEKEYRRKTEMPHHESFRSYRTAVFQSGRDNLCRRGKSDFCPITGNSFHPRYSLV